MPSFELRYAPHAWRLLRGCFCVYKPTNKGFLQTRKSIIDKLIYGLNSMETRPTREMVEIEGQLSTGELKVVTKPNLADHPLVVGERYGERDISLMLANNPGWYASGVVVAFIGSAASRAPQFANSNHLRVYEIKGQFGFATDNCRHDGRIVEKSRYKHIKESHLGRVLSKIQAIQQNKMFQTIGVDIRSEEAYEMAAKGAIRPNTRKTSPILYGIKLTNFELPDFTIEVQCVNEHEPYMTGLIHEIGLQVKSSAMCTGLRLTRLGPFSIDHALVFKHWTVEHIINNIQKCNSLLKPHLMTPLSANISDPNAMDDHEIFLEMLKRNEGEIIK